MSIVKADFKRTLNGLEPLSTRFKPGSTPAQPRLNPGSTLNMAYPFFGFLLSGTIKFRI